jgi:hypothetical protein
LNLRLILFWIAISFAVFTTKSSSAHADEYTDKLVALKAGLISDGLTVEQADGVGTLGFAMAIHEMCGETYYSTERVEQMTNFMVTEKGIPYKVLIDAAAKVDVVYGLRGDNDRSFTIDLCRQVKEHPFQ